MEHSAVILKKVTEVLEDNSVIDTLNLIGQNEIENYKDA